MDSISHESIIMRQRERILARIDRALQLLNEYENIILVSDSPKEKLRAEENIDTTRQLISKYQDELDSLGKRREVTSTPQSPIFTSPVKEEMREGDVRNAAKEQEITPSDGVQELDRRLKDLQRGIDDLKRGQGVIYQLLTETRNQELKAIITLIRQGAFAKEEMTQTLEFVHQSLLTLQENQERLSVDVQKAIADTSSALSSEASLQGKLELTLPIIPLLLDYKVELAATNSVDLNKLWENTQIWWKSLTTKASERTDRELMNKYLEEFKAKEGYLVGFESRINQSSPNVFIKAELEFGELAKLALELDSDLDVLNLTTKLTRSALQRMVELAKSISYQAHSAAAAIASGGRPTIQISHIKQSLPTLHQLIHNLIAKLSA